MIVTTLGFASLHTVLPFDHEGSFNARIFGATVKPL